MRERYSVRINLALERLAEWFSHSQDPKPTKAARIYAGSPAVVSASDKGAAIDAWISKAAHIPLIL